MNSSKFTAYYAVLFPSAEEAAFSNYLQVETLGAIVTIALGKLVCTDTLIRLLGGLLIVGMTGFGFAEERRRKEWVRKRGNK